MTEDQPLVIFANWDSGGAVSWQTKTQQTVALSSCEAEYKALTAAVQEPTSSRSWLCEMGYQQMNANGHWWRQSELHQTGYKPWDAQLIEAHRHEIPPHTREKPMTTQFNSSTRQQFNWQQTCWGNHSHKLKWSNIESTYWVDSRFFFRPTEKSEWRCWGKDLRKSWARNLGNFTYSSSKLKRNKLICVKNSILFFQLCFCDLVRNGEPCPTRTKFPETHVSSIRLIKPTCYCWLNVCCCLLTFNNKNTAFFPNIKVANRWHA